MSALKPSSSAGSPRIIPVIGHLKYEHLFAGVSGGAVSTLILHPLDLIKIRFAVNDGKTKSVPQYSGLINAYKVIKASEGYRGLWKGAAPNILGSGFSWGCYFLIYESIKTWIQGGDPKKPLGPMLNMFAAANAGILTLFMTNPIWVVKTRLCLQYASDIQLEESKRYYGTRDALSKIYRTEGIRGLYKGLVPGMFGVTHGAIQFMTYEEMKNRYNQYRNLPIDNKLHTIEYIGFAASSKVVAAGLTYPYQVIRARVQDHHHNYKSTWHCVHETWRLEGVRGLYKGFTPYLCHVIPNITVVLLFYEVFANH